MAVRILTDSTSYLSKSLRQELDIGMVSLNISFGQEAMREMDIDNKSFYQMMASKGIPTSSQPAVGEMYEQMVRLVEAGHNLCCIFLSSDLSGTLATGQMAKEMVLIKHPDAQIEIIDSRSTCMQLGFAVVIAARAAKAGRLLTKVKAAVLENMKRSRFLFVPENLEYLRKGGRIGAAGALIGNLFKIVPILTLEDGKVAVVAKVRTKSTAINTMVEKLLEDTGRYGLGEIVVHHINCLKEAEGLARTIKDKVEADVRIMDIGPVIGLHVGPGAMGIAYYTKQDLR